VAPGDLDGDGDPDVVVSGFQRIDWYRNPDWAPQPIAEGSFGRGGKTLVRDVDGDGRLDVITGAFDDALPLFSGGLTMVWFRTTAAGWERRLLSEEAYCHDLLFGDLDGDGREDGLCLDQQRGQVLRLLPPADPLAPWSVETIDADENAMGSAIADIDRDGRPDVVVGRAWYRNGGDGTWTRHEYTSITVDGYDGFRDFAKVSVLDLDGDGRLDVFATLYAETPAGVVYAFLAPPDPASDAWLPVLVDAGPLFGVHSQGAAPFDGTSRPQIMVGETNAGGFEFGVNPDPQIYVYRLLGPASDPASWERTLVDGMGTHEAQIVDLDRDGLPDIVGHEENTDLLDRNGGVFAWRNQTAR
ncbi:MAG TPA: VCBS repeat-containing protein, partial [Candidatus Binatia bacterium]|nr:VCBS repeat-containing protein [Candidatus Binatia bacterium]